MYMATKPVFIALAPVRANAWSNDGEHFVSFGDDRENCFSINVENERYAYELAAAINAVADMQTAPEPVQVGDAAASAVMNGVAAGGGVMRLVPRGVPVKSAGAMGTTSPGGGEAA